MTALDDIAFLARSANRIRVLDALADRPHTRAELQASLDIPRATVGRIATDLTKRGLASEERGRYESTMAGAFLAAELDSLTDRTETVRKLSRVTQWLPVADLDVPLSRLADATVTTVRHGDPTAPVRRAEELTRDAEHITFLSDAFIPYLYEGIWQRATGDGTAMGVISTAVFEAIRESPSIAVQARETLASGQVDFFRCAGSCPTMALIDGKIAAIVVLDDEDNVRALIDTEDEVIRSWAVATIDEYRNEAEPLDPEDFAE